MRRTKGILTCLLAGLALIGTEGAATAGASNLAAMSRAGAAICNELGPALHPNACRRMQIEIAKTTPDVYQLSMAVEATAQAARAPKVTARQIGSYDAAALRVLRGYAPGYRRHGFRDGLAPAPSQRPCVGNSSNPLRYYDDNAWVGVALLDMYRQTRDKRYLRAAKQVWQFEQTGQHTAHGADAGIWWNTCKNKHYFPRKHKKTGKNYISSGSTGGAIRLALELDQIHHDPDERQFAVRNYHWARTYLLNAGSQLYANTALKPKPTPAHQGWFVDDGRLLNEIVGKAFYLKQAKATAVAAAARFRNHPSHPHHRPYRNFDASQFGAMFASFVRLDRTNATYTNALRKYAAWVTPQVKRSGAFCPSHCNKPGMVQLQQAGAAWTLTLRGLLPGAGVTHAGSGKHPRHRRRPAKSRADRQIAQNAVLRLSDFPPGWQAHDQTALTAQTAVLAEGAATTDISCGLNTLVHAGTATRNSPEFTNATLIAQESVSLLPGRAAAKRWFARLTSPSTRRCIGAMYARGAEHASGAIKFGKVRTGSLSITPVGDQSAAFRFTSRFTDSANGRSGTVSFDLEFIRARRGLETFLFVGAYHPFPSGLEAQLAITPTVRLTDGLG